MKKGISLIVLVITIIIMIILAGAIVITLNNSGIINKANEAVDVSNLNEVKQLASLLWAEAYAEGKREQVELAIEVMNGLAGIDGLNINDYIITVTTEGVTVEKGIYIYYTTLIGAVNDVNNGTIGTNSIEAKSDAAVGVCVNNGTPYIVLLKDTTEETRVQPSVDMTINLGGHTLSANDKVVMNVLGGNVIIDGTTSGSEIQANNVDAQVARALQVEFSGNVTSLGGTYVSNSQGAQSSCISTYDSAILNMSNAIISTTDMTGTIRAIEITGTTKGHISNCAITVNSYGGNGIGINNFSDITISNCDIKVYEKYNSESGNYPTSSMGILNRGTAIITNCYIMGSYSSVANYGSLYVDGGIYESYGLVGVYFGGTETIARVKNAILRKCDDPDGYTNTNYTKAGIIIGDNNIRVYIDNCDINAEQYPVVLQGKNNTIYISNSKVNLDSTDGIKIVNTTNKLYIGIGCNFTAEDTTLPDVVERTNEVYK